jgi:DNA-binding response OmpR family regulator
VPVLQLKEKRNEGRIPDDEDPRMASETATSPAAARGSSAIVLIEPDQLIRGLITEWLTTAGYTVRLGYRSDGVDAGDVAAIIVDLYMPRESGAQIIRAVQRAYPGKPVIATSAQFRPGLAHSDAAARELGARRLVPKPFGRTDLLDAVRAAIDQPE